MRSPFYTLATIALASASFAADAPNKGKNQAPHTGPCQLGLRVEYYELDHQAVHDLLAAPTSRTDATKLRREILAKVALDEAALVQSSYVITRSGQRAKVESITEWIYPTEFDPPEVPQELSGPVSSGDDIVAPATPTAFETRNVGHTFEVDPVIAADGLTVDLNLAPELLVYLGDNRLGRGGSRLEQPVFHTIKDAMGLSLRTGTWAVLGVHSPPPPSVAAPSTSPRRVLSLVRADIIDVGNPETTEKAQGWQAPANPDHADDPFAAAAEAEQRRSSAEIAKQIAIHTEWIELDALAATRLLDQHAGGWSDATPLRTQLQKLISKNRASLRQSNYLVTRSGQRARSQSVVEWIYPTGVKPPTVPQKLTGPVDPGAAIKTQATYTGFTTRNVGTNVEVDPVIGADGVTVDVNMAPEIVTLGATKHHGHGDSEIETPVFYTIKDSVAFSCHDGTSVLVGMHSPQPEDVTGANFHAAKRILVFATTRIIEAR